MHYFVLLVKRIWIHRLAGGMANPDQEIKLKFPVM